MPSVLAMYAHLPLDPIKSLAPERECTEEHLGIRSARVHDSHGPEQSHSWSVQSCNCLHGSTCPGALTTSAHDAFPQKNREFAWLVLALPILQSHSDIRSQLPMSQERAERVGGHARTFCGHERSGICDWVRIIQMARHPLKCMKCSLALRTWP